MINRWFYSDLELTKTAIFPHFGWAMGVSLVSSWRMGECTVSTSRTIPAMIHFVTDEHGLGHGYNLSCDVKIVGCNVDLCAFCHISDPVDNNNSLYMYICMCKYNIHQVACENILMGFVAYLSPSHSSYPKNTHNGNFLMNINCFPKSFLKLWLPGFLLSPSLLLIETIKYDIYI